MPTLILIRGLPGSGKSTLAKRMTGYVHVEADMYFERSGPYRFDASQLPQAHQYCLQRTREALMQGCNVVVANTFVKISEMQPYLTLGVPVRIVEATGQFTNIHNVSASVIEVMKANWERLPQDWADRIIHAKL
jgi:predicted kinase